MASPNRDKYKAGSGKLLDSDDAVFDLTAWIKNIGTTIGNILTGQDTLGIANTSDTRVDPATEGKQDEIVTLLTQFVADETNVVAEFLLNGGSNQQNVDGSITPVVFSSTVVPANKKFIASRIMIYMEDSTAFTSDKFGGLSGLTNGWLMKINDSDMFNAKTNEELAIFMFDFTGNELFGKINQTMLGRFSFSRFTDGADGITIREGETLDVVVQDDLRGLDHLHVMVQGVYKDV